MRYFDVYEDKLGVTYQTRYGSTTMVGSLQTVYHEKYAYFSYKVIQAETDIIIIIIIIITTHENAFIIVPF
ncbi:MAG: hypothetical protein M3Y53_00720 [Thermoproteota archaeon]|nr:hypothetical protein [Thermoproteota archaeon]